MLKIFSILVIGFLHFSCFSMNYDKLPLDQHKMETCRDSNWVNFSIEDKGVWHSSIHVDLCKGPVLKMLHIKGHNEPFCLLLANKKCDIPCCDKLFLALKTQQRGFVKGDTEKFIDSERCSISITPSNNSSNHKSLEIIEDNSTFDQSVCLLACDLYISGKNFCVFNVDSATTRYTLVSGDLLSVSTYVKELSDRAKCTVTEKLIDKDYTKYNYYGVSFSKIGYDTKDVPLINSNDTITNNFNRNDIITFFTFPENQTSLLINEMRGSTSCKLSIDSNHRVFSTATTNEDAVYSHLYKFKDSVFSSSVIYMPVGHSAQEDNICIHRQSTVS